MTGQYFDTMTVASTDKESVLEVLEFNCFEPHSYNFHCSSYEVVNLMWVIDQN